MTLSLYRLATTYDTLRQLAAEPDDDPDAWSEALLDIQDEAKHKIAALGLLITEWQAERAVINAEIARLQARAESRFRAVVRVQEYLLAEMPRLDISRVEDPRITVALQNNPPAVSVTEPDLVPAAYVRWTVRLPLEEVPAELLERDNAGEISPDVTYDKRAILAASSEGNEVPGTRIVRGQHIRLR